MGSWVKLLDGFLLLVYFCLIVKCNSLFKLSEQHEFSEFVKTQSLSKRELIQNDARSYKLTDQITQTRRTKDDKTIPIRMVKRDVFSNTTSLNSNGITPGAQPNTPVYPLNSNYVIHTQYVRNHIIDQPQVVQRSSYIIHPAQQHRTIVQQIKTPILQQINNPKPIKFFNQQVKTNFQPIATKDSDQIITNHGDELLRSFMRPTQKSDQQKIAAYITSRMQISNTSGNASNNTQAPNYVNQTANTTLDFTNQSSSTNFYGALRPKSIFSTPFDTNRPQITSEAQNEKSRPSIVSFFKEENNGDDDDDTALFENSFMNGLTSLEDNIPIISKLIQGTLDQDIERENDAIHRKVTTKTLGSFKQPKHILNTTVIDSQAPDYDIMLDNYYNSRNNETTVKDSVIDAGNLTEMNNTTAVNQSSIQAFGDKPKHHEKDDVNVSELVRTYEKIENENVTKTTKPINQNKIKFFLVKSHKPHGVCMDGTRPGYYLRRSLTKGENKWIIHLHGGAWCYDLHSCLKRRKTILGSTERSNKADISSFFHGLLSKSFKVNPDFYDWNVAVLSYCDGGLFSGTRKSSISGKGKEFHFQGRDILQTLMEDLLDQQKLTHATDVILSGTSAGGLALALQGDFVRSYIPPKAKVRGLIDAALFLDRNTDNGLQLARQQFKALYSLHRPILNKKCLDSVARKHRYLCLFPEHSIRYLDLPVFIVNSLYDHWQLSYLNGLDCVYDEKRCDTKQHDDILDFRNHMFRTIKDIKRYKNDTGVFANSCFGHGQAILDYTWRKVKISNNNIAELFSNWYNDDTSNDFKRHFLADCKYPCNGSCPKFLAQKCVANFKGASEHRRKRDSELC